MAFSFWQLAFVICHLCGPLRKSLLCHFELGRNFWKPAKAPELKELLKEPALVGQHQWVFGVLQCCYQIPSRDGTSQWLQEFGQ